MALLRIGYLGPAGTFSHGALEATGAEGEQVPVETVRDAVLGVQDGTLDRALVPVENAIEGGITATIDTLVREAPDVIVCGEHLEPISNALLVRPGVTLEQVRRVRSHPQPLAQCRATLARLLPGIPLHADTSTAAAIEAVMAAAEPEAAVGAAGAAPRYGATVIAKALEDEPGNITRFWWLSRGDPDDGREPSDPGPWKCSIVWDGDGDTEPGWLLACLRLFADRDLNLTRIESRPSLQRLGHYVFVIDVQAHHRSAPLAAALAELRSRSGGVRVLGSYRPAQPGHGH